MEYVLFNHCVNLDWCDTIVCVCENMLVALDSNIQAMYISNNANCRWSLEFVSYCGNE